MIPLKEERNGKYSDSHKEVREGCPVKIKKNSKKARKVNNTLIEDAKQIIGEFLQVSCTVPKTWVEISKFLNKNGYIVGTLRGEILYLLNSKFGAKLKEPKRKTRKISSTGIKKPKENMFYNSIEWRRLRYQALKRDKGTCQLCGRTRGHGIILHVDHIKPRSLYPSEELNLSNLQTLCEDCNMGKGNGDSIDWR